MSASGARPRSTAHHTPAAVRHPTPQGRSSAAASSAASPYTPAHAASPYPYQRTPPLSGSSTGTGVGGRLRSTSPASFAANSTLTSSTASTRGRTSSPPRSTTLQLLPPPESEMSLRTLLQQHLEDFEVLVQALMEAIVHSGTAAAAAATASAMTSRSAVGGGSSALSPSITPSAHTASIARGTAALNIDTLLSRLLRKSSLFDSCVDQLLRHQALEAKLRQQREELAQLDASLIHFCAEAAQHERRLGTLAKEKDHIANLEGKGKKQSFAVADVLAYSEILGRMSVSPADHIERKSGYNENTCRPPAPIDKYMAFSSLHRSLEELVTISREDKKAEEERAKAEKEGKKVEMESAVAGAETGMEGAALQRQESAQSASSSALPSFAELDKGAAAMQATQLWRQESARSMTAAPVALDLDLESSDSESDDD